MATRPLHLSFLLLCLSFLIKSQAEHVPALYVFGDSLVDSGNNNEQSTVAKANYPPYGIDYVVGTTGRFTNGFTVADYLSDTLDLEQLPPFLDGANIMESSAGYNFASGSAGILPETGTMAGKNLNLRMQVGWFRRTVDTVLTSRFKNPERLSHHLSRSIFLVAIGSNDYAINYLMPQFSNTSSMYNPQQFAELLVNELGNQLQEMYKLGGRKFVVFEVGPIGCLPGIIAMKRAGPKTQCVEEINDLVSIFNAKLAPKINQLNSTLRNSTFVLVKTFNLVHDMVKNPSRYGFKDSRNPCCVVSEMTGACVADTTPCKDRAGHVFWDAVHPSDAVNRIIANEMFNGTSLSTPMNVLNLVNAHKL